MTRWHNRGDRPVDRARQVAAAYRDALLRVAPAECAAIDQAAIHVREDWVIPQTARHQPDDLVTAAEAAALTGRSVRWVYAWIAADRSSRVRTSTPQIRVRAGDVQEASSSVKHGLT